MFKRLVVLWILFAICRVGPAGEIKQGEEMELLLHSYQAFPAISERAAWEKVRAVPENQAFIGEIFREAEEAMTSPVPPCSAIKFMEFNRTGNRSNYEKEYFRRRSRLLALVLAEGLEYKGRYTDMIIEYLCAISAEYTWAIPAHTAQKDVLPYFEREEIDLFSAETSHLVAQTLALMEKELAAVSPNLVKRLKKQVADRAIVPVETSLERYWWRDLTSNWNPWICSNLLGAANVLLADDPARLTAYAQKLTAVTDRYYQAYSEDGGCEEGPTYWTVSPVTYFLYLEALFRMSDGKINRFGDGKFRRMCEYIVAPFCGEGEVVAFGDSGRYVGVPVGILRRMADRIGSRRLREFADVQAAAVTRNLRCYFGGLAGLYELFQGGGEKTERQDYLLAYSGLEQLFLRRGDRFLAVKAGSNGENHGHLDVGQFVFRIGGRFLALDLGAVEYTKKTFSHERFEIPALNSMGHNPLRFNGIGQGNGKEFAARDFHWEGDHGKLTITMELAGCYPKELGLISYRRTLSFDGRNLTVRDEYKAEKELVPMMTVFSEFDNPVLRSNAEVKCEVHRLTDSKLKAAWGECLTRVTLSGNPAKAGVVELTFGIEDN